MAKRKHPEKAEKPGKKRPKPPHRGPSGVRRPGVPAAHDGAYWLYGQHAVLAALANPERRPGRLLLTDEAQRRPDVVTVLEGAGARVTPDVVVRDEIAAQLPEGAVHQGLALKTKILPEPAWPAFLDRLQEQPPSESGRPLVLVALDQVTDPQNVGAVMRSAAAFGAAAVLATRHHAPDESASLAKAASGAFERLPYFRVGNLTKALGTLKASGFWSIGLAAEGRQSLAQIPPSERTVIVLGAEGKGLRRLTREHCDFLARLPTQDQFGHLNVSNAAAIALYELLGRAAAGPDSA